MTGLGVVGGGVAPFINHSFLKVNNSQCKNDGYGSIVYVLTKLFTINSLLFYKSYNFLVKIIKHNNYVNFYLFIQNQPCSAFIHAYLNIYNTFKLENLCKFIGANKWILDTFS